MKINNNKIPVLALLGHRPFVSTGHLTLVAGLTGRAHFNGGVLKRRGCHCHLVATLHRSVTINEFRCDANDYPSTTYLHKAVV